MEKLFSYGTLQKREVQIELFGREIKRRADVLPGYAVRPIQFGDEMHKLAVADANDAINGHVLELSEGELATCDAYEPAEYKRVEVTLASGKMVWAYVAAN